MNQAEAEVLVDELWRRVLSGEPGHLVLEDLAKRHAADMAPLRQRIVELQAASAAAAAAMARLDRRAH